MGAMSALMPILVVLLALIAAGSIAYIAWELSSEEFHRSFGDPESDTRPEPDDGHPDD